MAAGTIIVLILLAIAIGVLIFFIVSTSNKKKELKQKNVILPFSGILSPPSPPWTVNISQKNSGVASTPEGGLRLLGMMGGTTSTAPQIQCPVGTSINIIGAFFDINDPYGECSNTANSTVRLTCGDGTDLTSAPTCTDGDDSTCPAGMTCYSSKCIPATCSIDTDCTGGGLMNACPASIGQTCSTQSSCGSGAVCIDGVCQVDPGTGSCMKCGPQGTCMTLPTCMNVNEGLNSICSPGAGDGKKCRPRDASAWLASVCDGEQTCMADSNWLPNQQGGAFGPLPCHISAASGNGDYASLPIIQGWSGGAPAASATGAIEPSTFGQGYKVHGIYTCIPTSE